MLQNTVGSSAIRLTIFLAINSCLGIEFLNWGDKCEIPRQGGGEMHHALKEECDGGKGLICTGQACECTYQQRYSYDPVSKECRRRVGKPCQFVEVNSDAGIDALARLPFNLKCHDNAECTQFKVPVPNLNPKRRVVASGGRGKYGIRIEADPEQEYETVSMCVCKPPLVASSDYNACIPAPSLNPIAEMFAAPKTKLTFRPPYYTS